MQFVHEHWEYSKIMSFIVLLHTMRYSHYRYQKHSYHIIINIIIDNTDYMVTLYTSQYMFIKYTLLLYIRQEHIQDQSTLKNELL